MDSKRAQCEALRAGAAPERAPQRRGVHDAKAKAHVLPRDRGPDDARGGRRGGRHPLLPGAVVRPDLPPAAGHAAHRRGL